MTVMSRIKEHMEVIGADGVHVGTVDRVEEHRIAPDAHANVIKVLLHVHNLLPDIDDLLAAVACQCRLWSASVTVLEIKKLENL